MILVSQIAFAAICLTYGGISSLLKTHFDPMHHTKADDAAHDVDKKTSRLFN